MGLGWFLNPVGEVDDKSDKMVEGVAKASSAGDIIYEPDEEDVVIPKVSYAEALQALQKV